MTRLLDDYKYNSNSSVVGNNNAADAKGPVLGPGIGTTTYLDTSPRRYTASNNVYINCLNVDRR